MNHYKNGQGSQTAFETSSLQSEINKDETDFAFNILGRRPFPLNKRKIPIYLKEVLKPFCNKRPSRASQQPVHTDETSALSTGFRTSFNFIIIHNYCLFKRDALIFMRKPVSHIDIGILTDCRLFESQPGKKFSFL